MEILRFLFYAFLLYLAFRLVFDFIIPVYKTTKRVKRGFREMQDRMNQNTAPGQHNNYTKQSPGNNKTDIGDYIDFEEIKD